MALNLNTPTKPREQLLTLALMVAIVVMFYRTLYAPKKEIIKVLEAQAQTLKTEKTTLDKFMETLIAKIPEMEPSAISKIISNKVKILNGEMPSEAKDASAMLTRISAKPLLSGILIKELKDTAVEQTEGVQKGKFSVTVQGSFRNVTKFLETIEEIPALFTIDNISLESAEEQAATVEMQVDGTLFSVGKSSEELGEIK